MLLAYKVFLDDIADLEAYISMAQTTSELLQNNFSMSKATYKDVLLKLQNQSKVFNKRKLDYSMVIVNLYGALEKYIESFIKEYLMHRVSYVEKYSELPQCIIDEHFMLSLELIQKIDYPKYLNMFTKEQIIKNLNDCVSDEKLVLNYEAFCIHSANFRVSEIQKVMKRIGLVDLVNNIKRNEELKKTYIKENGECEYEQLPLDNIFSFVNELADRRNQIAHGANTDIISSELQLEMMRKIKLFVEEINNLCFEDLLEYFVQDSYKIQKIYNVNKKTKILCFQLECNKIATGDIVIKKRDEKYTYCTISRIEINKESYDEVNAETAIDIAIMLSSTRKENEEYWLYNSSC